MRPILSASAFVAAVAGIPITSHAAQEGSAAGAQRNSTEAEQTDPIVVTGRRLDLAGESISASEGVIAREDLDSRPLLRAGDLLEFVPGLVATQHSGSGKANQYFLRGFNLDHGTDFATFVDAMPVNMRTHGHGQGWTDLNFLSPETMEELRYRKGPYHADVGDFSSAGSAQFRIADRVALGLAEVSAGSFGYLRGVTAKSVKLGGGDLLVGAELQTFDGSWADIAENVAKKNGLLRFSRDVGSGRGHVMAMAYDNAWNSPDQIPERAVRQGLISRFGSIDPTLGGTASRYSMSGGWTGPAAGGSLDVGVYALRSRLSLYSNFTYLLEDPENGDQFRQVDRRSVYGFKASQEWKGRRSRWSVGADARFDDIGRVGLSRTAAHKPVGTVREDRVNEGSVGVYAFNETTLSDKLRSYVGVRYDHFAFDVDALSLPANSGSASDGKLSFKGSLVLRPVKPLDLYLSAGQGFHSNDARGTTISIDPISGDPAERADPIVGSEGAEAGARLFVTDRIHATLAAWALRLESELLFVGDAGNTEASRPSRRTGVEATLYYFRGRHLSAELEASYTNSRFRDEDAAGPDIPGSIPLVISGGLTVGSNAGWTATGRLRYFGGYPLVEDGSVRSAGSLLVNLRVGRERGAFGAYLDLFNLLDSRDHDVDYFYASRLPGEPFTGVADIHSHVFQPRSARVTLRHFF